MNITSVIQAGDSNDIVMIRIILVFISQFSHTMFIKYSILICLLYKLVHFVYQLHRRKPKPITFVIFVSRNIHPKAQMTYQPVSIGKVQPAQMPYYLASS